jgi:SAM-dependent methyltransferase
VKVVRGVPEASAYDAENYRPDTAATVQFLAELADGGELLEFGAGTGRLLIPLAELCKSVIGVDLSSDMVGRLNHDGLPSNLELQVGNMVDWSTGRRFDLVACVFNTLLEIPDRDDQYQALLNAAGLVKGGGFLVIENAHPPLRSMASGRRVTPLEVSGIEFGIVTQNLDWKSQKIDQRIMIVTEGAVVTRRLLLRAIFPAEQDALLLGAGLRLRNRYSDWRGTPWRAGSADSEVANVVSVYERPPQEHC